MTKKRSTIFTENITNRTTDKIHTFSCHSVRKGYVHRL